MSLMRQGAMALFQQIQAQERSAVSVLDESYTQIDKTDGDIQAFNSLTKDHAYSIAQQVDKLAVSGEKLPLLAGVPLALKDNIHLLGASTTCSSNILENYVAPFNATVTEKLNTHLIPIVGKTNLDEFAMGSSTENSAFRQTKNPWDLSRVPGGSSGGSAAAVSAGHVPFSLGSDTGGSVRQPASLCGLVGLKPTYGLVSRYGLVAFASSLDQISPFTLNVEDMAALLEVIVGPDLMDSTSLQGLPQPDYLTGLKQSIEGLKIGYIEELMGDGIQSETKAAIEQAMKTYTDLGATILPISLPSLKYAIATYYIIATAEASSNLARYDGVRYGTREVDDKDILTMYMTTRAKGFGAEVKRRIMLGTYALSSGYYDAYYGKAQKVRALIRHEFAKAFGQVDLLLGPTSPFTAFKIGEKANDPVQMYLSDIATIPVNLAGIPAMSFPCGFDTQGLPIGLQLFGPHLSEAKMLQAAFAFEQKTGLRNLEPKALANV